MLGSISIAVNSITGPAMVNLPATFLKSGIVPTIATLVFVGALCSWSSLHLANAISKMGDSPNHRYGNRNFQQEIEFSQAFQRTFRQHQRTWYWMTQFLFWGCITCLNISAIVDTAQVVDTFVGHHGYYGTGALVLHFYPKHNINNSSSSSLLGGVAEWVYWDASVCTADELLDGECLPFAEWEHVPDIALITVGKVLVTLVFLPLALMDLKENVAWQVLAFLILLVTSVQFVVQFAALGGTVRPTTTTPLTWWGHDWDDLLGVVLFNFPLVLAIPAWLYEREPHVDVATVVQCSTALSVVLYTVLGWMGARALPHVSENMVESMLSGCWGTTLQLGATLFTFAIVGLNIPLFSVLMRLNLMGGTVFDDDNNNNDNTRPAVAIHCSRTLANVAAVGIPFTVAWLLHGGEAVTKLLSYGGVFFTSLVAFILPLVLALQVAKQSGQDNFAARGSIDMVSGGALWWTKKRRSSKTTTTKEDDDADDAMKHWEIASLRILLTVTILSVVAAILGNALDS